MIVISTHAVFAGDRDIHGPPHALSEFLNHQKEPHLFIKHNLYTATFSRVEKYADGKLQKSEDIPYPKVGFFKYLYEMMLSASLTRTEEEKTITLFVGVNPLNALVGNFLKAFGAVRRTVYFSADFALKRFDNPVMNGVYHALDRLAMFQADQTWSVSQRIVDFRRKNGLSDSKNIRIPNAPFFHSIPRPAKHEVRIHDLVIVSALEKGVDFLLLLQVLLELKKSVPDIKLHLIGSGSQESKLKKYIRSHGLSKNVQFHGALSHKDMFQVLTRCGIGIALYENAPTTHFRFFSDPMKVRDYLASGLPVIVSGNSGIGKELEKNQAGFQVDLTQKEIIKILLPILTQKEEYQRLRKNALQLARQNDMQYIYEQTLSFFH